MLQIDDVFNHCESNFSFPFILTVKSVNMHCINKDLRFTRAIVDVVKIREYIDHGITY